MTRQHVHLPKTLLAFFWHFLKRQWIWLLLIQIFSFAWSLDHTLWPYVLMKFIDIITHYVGDKTDVWYILREPILMGLGLWITLEISFRLSGILTASTFPRVEADIRMSMYDYVQHHSHLYFSNQMAGAIANKISDMPQTVSRVLQQLMHLFLPVGLALIISTTFFAMINPFFALILVSWVIIHMGICLAFSKKCDEYSSIHAEARSQLSGKIVDSLTNSTNIRLFARTRFEGQYLSSFQRDELTKH